ncbi:MAG: right-handed parallel beta-helix repeat-containing protein, partial [Miltoncostaeaceae bacterium]
MPPLGSPARRLVIAAALGGALAAALATGPAAAAAPSCDLHAHSGGSDSAPGSAEAPVRNAQKLVSMLSPGQVGCLASGQVFAESLRIENAGDPGDPITLRSEPGGSRATVRGRVVVTSAAHDVVIDDLVLDASTAGQVTSPYVYGRRITFSNNDVSNGHAGRSCFLIGSNSYVAHDITLDGNRIHDCGRLPATNLDHGIYALASRNLVLTGNHIYGNADWGVHLYPDADDSHIANNTIDRNGSGIIFAGDYGDASGGNVVTRNLITNSLIKADVEAWWPSGNPVGTGNVVYDNCVHGGPSAFSHRGGFTEYDNILDDPRYLNGPGGDYRLQAGSPCAGRGASEEPTEPPPPPPNQDPTAGFSVAPSAPAVGETVTFTDSSTDVDGTIASREWDLDGDGAYDDSTAPA